MGCSGIKAGGVHNGMVRASVKVSDDVFDKLEHCFRWVSIIARDG